MSKVATVAKLVGGCAGDGDEVATRTSLRRINLGFFDVQSSQQPATEQTGGAGFVPGETGIPIVGGLRKLRSLEVLSMILLLLVRLLMMVF
jgi:hypothetical protein